MAGALPVYRLAKKRISKVQPLWRLLWIDVSILQLPKVAKPSFILWKLIIGHCATGLDAEYLNVMKRFANYSSRWLRGLSYVPFWRESVSGD